MPLTTGGAHCALASPYTCRSLLTTLESQGKLTSLRQDLLPFLTQQQVKLRLPVEQATAATGTGTAAPSGSATQNSSMQRQASAIFDGEGGEAGEASELDYNGRMPGEPMLAAGSYIAAALLAVIFHGGSWSCTVCMPEHNALRAR